ncbi:MAG: elongation factor P [Anaerolineae bacterium]|nr:elongation factor P [Anaerolineae bacterium]NUQ05182.1 elongation factor P [Anaerolineae bacterium]
MKKGTVIDLNGTLYRIANTQYNNPGRGAASMRAQLVDIRTGNAQYRVFAADESLNNLYVESEKVQFLYKDGDALHFMNMQSYDQYEVPLTLFGDDALYLKEEMELELSISDGLVIDYTLPTTVIMTVAEAEIAIAGNTAGSVTKRVKTNTGLSVQVPAFVNEGDTIKVDSRDGSYIGRG